MQLFVNNFLTTLLAPIDTSATRLSIDPAQAAKLTDLVAGSYYLLTLAAVDGSGIETAWEVIKVTAVAGGLLTVERAIEGAVLSWPAMAGLSARVTKGTFERLRDASKDQIAALTARIVALEASSAGGIPDGALTDGINILVDDTGNIFTAGA